jgi:aspartate/methionine/tyrosine aminotransferase
MVFTDRLLEEGIVVSPGRFFGPGGEGFIRLALVPTVAECAGAADALRSLLA